MKKDTVHLMTEGSVPKQILLFTLPLLLGNLFQQLYNTADSVILGKYESDAALAAVSSSGSLILLLNSLFVGIFVGAGVVISREFGAGHEDTMKRAIHTTVAFSLFSCVILTVLGVSVTPLLLQIMGTPESVMPESVAYFRIYFAGISTTLLYNAGSGILRAMGDSKRPLYYLIAAVCVNILLDLIFVAKLGWGVKGAALATVLSQALSAALTFRKLLVTSEIYRVNIKEIRLDRLLLREIVRIGLPGGIQNSIVSLSNVVVQSNINHFGELAMAGCGAYAKVEGFALMPAGSFALALTTFVGQNLGAGKFDRVKKGAIIGTLLSITTAEVIGLFIYIFARPTISMFSSDPTVIAYGALQAKTVVLFYCLLAFSHAVAGVLRGAGLAKVPMLVMAGSWCLLRMTWITVMMHFYENIQLIFWAYPITWAVSTVILAVYSLQSGWLKHYKKAHEEGLKG